MDALRRRSDVLPDAGKDHLPRHGSEHHPRSRAAQRDARLPGHGKVRGQIGIFAPHGGAGARQIPAKARPVHGGTVQFKRRGMAGMRAGLRQHHAHFQPFGRAIRLQSQKRPGKGHFALQRWRRVYHHQQINIAGRPAKTAQRERTVRIRAQQIFAKAGFARGTQAGQKVPNPRVHGLRLACGFGGLEHAKQVAARDFPQHLGRVAAARSQEIQ